MSLSKILTETRRLHILTLLAEAGPINTGLLADGITRAGVPSDHDQIMNDVRWLAREGLVTSAPAGPFTVVTITKDGADVAAGRKIRQGIALAGC